MLIVTLIYRYIYINKTHNHEKDWNVYNNFYSNIV
mgnify:CR=1 FL=1